MTGTRVSTALMIVSADAGPVMRADVAAGLRPCPEYLRLQERHGVRLLDWTELGVSAGHRSISRSVHHVAATLTRRHQFDVVLSDGEHVGIPLALAMAALRIKTPHVVIAHHLITPTKARMFRRLKAHHRMDRILVHSPHQIERITRELGVPASRLHLVPFAVDTDYWAPGAAGEIAEENDFVVAAGREHRDYLSLVEACREPLRVFITDDSSHSQRAHRTAPPTWPANVVRRSVSTTELRQLYARAGVVVVPLLETDFSAGITAVLEAMSMGKAVVVSGTSGLEGVVTNGETAMVVKPGDVAQLHDAVTYLLDHPQVRQRLGAEARRVAVERHCLDGYVDVLAHHLGQVSGDRREGDG